MKSLDSIKICGLEKKLKEETLDELADTQIKLKGVEADLTNEKEERKKKMKQPNNSK